MVTRDSLTKNEKILTIAIQELGSRVAVQVVHLHLMSFYEYVNVPIDSALHVSIERRIHLRLRGARAGLVPQTVYEHLQRYLQEASSSKRSIDQAVDGKYTYRHVPLRAGQQ